MMAHLRHYYAMCKIQKKAGTADTASTALPHGSYCYYRCLTVPLSQKNVREMGEIAMYVYTSSRRIASSSCRIVSTRFC